MRVEHRSPLIEALDPTPREVVQETPQTHAHDRRLTYGNFPIHPGCAECCGRRLCHWCLLPAKSSPYGGDGYTMQRWHDGFFYGACQDHAKDLAAMIAGRVTPTAVMA